MHGHATSKLLMESKAKTPTGRFEIIYITDHKHNVIARV